jgi:ArsR family transcriptional regulator, arsenate/arsenite/antimonite-responsive transcriptional repressor
MDNDLAIFKACADATRLRILFLLTERELCVCELMAVLDMPQGKISRHLAIMKQAGILTDRRDGIWVYYALVDASSGAISHIRFYLVQERNTHDQIGHDLISLRTLADQGKICVPHPSPAGLMRIEA